MTESFEVRTSICPNPSIGMGVFHPALFPRVPAARERWTAESRRSTWKPCGKPALL